MSTSGLSKDLSSLIDDYLKGHPSRTVSVLARKAKINYQTMRRIAQGENIPKLESLMSLLFELVGRNGMVMFLKKHYPEIADMLEQNFRVVPYRQIAGDKINRYLTTKEGFLILGLAGKSKGTTREEIKEQLGEYGANSLDDMLEDIEELSEINGRVKLGDISVTDLSIALSEYKIVADLFRKDRFGESGHFVGIKTEGVNQQTKEVVNQMLKDVWKAIGEKLAQPESKGDTLIALSALITTL